jgi:integrase
MEATGIRPIEAARLTFADIDFEGAKITAKSKKSKGALRRRQIFVANDMVLEFLRRKSQGKGPDDHVFVTRKGPFKTDSLYHEVKSVAGKLGLKHITTYGLRHKVGTDLGNNGASVFVIASILGHSNVNTTRRYVHENEKTLREAMTSRHLQRVI